MVMFRWTPEATREQKERVNFDYAVAADFDDLAGYLAYRENAEHQKIVETFIQPIVGARGAVQYEI
jgi:hypothetical protein